MSFFWCSLPWEGLLNDNFNSFNLTICSLYLRACYSHVYSNTNHTFGDLKLFPYIQVLCLSDSVFIKFYCIVNTEVCCTLKSISMVMRQKRSPGQLRINIRWNHARRHWSGAKHDVVCYESWKENVLDCKILETCQNPRNYRFRVLLIL